MERIKVKRDENGDYILDSLGDAPEEMKQAIEDFKILEQNGLTYEDLELALNESQCRFFIDKLKSGHKIEP